VAELAGYDVVVLATGVLPRAVRFPGADHPMVLSYAQALRGAPVGRRVAVIGTGGIGYDVAEFLTHRAPVGDPLAAFFAEWGVDYAGWGHPGGARGGLTPATHEAPLREVTMLQRSSAKATKRMGKTTGWIHRATLRQRGVSFLCDVEYDRVDDAGLHIRVAGVPRTLAVDNVVVCAGQESQAHLAAPLRAAGLTVHVIGGAEEAAELDAKRAIAQGVQLAASW